MFLHRLTTDIACEFGIPYYSINNKQYFDEIKQLSWKKFIEDKSKQGCFGPIRSGATEAIFPNTLSEYSIVLHLRDPRDVLTSFFFYHAYSHLKRDPGFHLDNAPVKPWKDMEIDRFVLDKLPIFKTRYQLLISILLGRNNVKFIKYEDMISNYSEWLENFLAAFSHLEIPSAQTLKSTQLNNSIAGIHQNLFEKYVDEFTAPIHENVYRHKRQLKPGDHKRKLQTSTIKRLNDELSNILKLLSYH